MPALSGIQAFPYSKIVVNQVENHGMADEEMCGFQEMWTTEQTDYALLHSGDNRYSIVQISTNMFVIIEDDDEFRDVTQQMITMGNRKFTMAEYKIYRSSTDR